MASKINAAIFYLTQNTDIRKTYLKTSLYFLFKNFNEKYKYNVIILHEGDYDESSKNEILMSIRSSCRSCVSFLALDKNDFMIPDYIDKDRMKKCIATNPNPYWRNENYRLMCRWWLVHFYKYAKGYDYVMRIDDDSFIEESVPDLFEIMIKKNLIYTSNMLHVDCGMCCYGMKDFFDKKYSDKKQIIDKLFVKQKIPSKSVQVHPFRTLLSINKEPIIIEEEIELSMPIIYYNNWFITKTEFWNRTEVVKVIDEIDKNGSIFYYRWGDAPLQSIITALFTKAGEVTRTIFKYSKRMQREAFYGNDKQFHSYMPETYDKSSCITEKSDNTQT